MSYLGKKPKTIRNLIILLSLGIVATTSIGFAAWRLVGYSYDHTSPSSGINPSDGEVVDLNDIFTFSEPTCFAYCPDGVIVDETLVTSGDVIVPLKVSLSKGASNFLDADNNFVFSVSTTMSNTKSDGTVGIDLIAGGYLSGFTYSQDDFNYLDDSYQSPTSTATSGSTHTSTYTVSDLSASTLYFNLKYTFSFSSVTDFNTTIFTPMNSNGGLNITLSVEVSQ